MLPVPWSSDSGIPPASSFLIWLQAPQGRESGYNVGAT